jgi:quercetin dioxygenase-like cupin family protein
MHSFQTQDLDLVQISSAQSGDPTREVRAAFPLHYATGSASTAMVYFELQPEMHLGTHVDSAEEILLVLEGEVEATLAQERARVAAGGAMVVPAMEPHDVRNCGETTARVCGIFSSSTTIAIFEEEFSVMGMEPTRFNGTPAPEHALVAH